MVVENRLEALESVLRAFFAGSAYFTRDELSSKGVGSLIRKPPKVQQAWPLSAKMASISAAVA